MMAHAVGGSAKLGMEQPQNCETARNQGDLNVDRSMILSWLREDVEWLRNKARCDNPGRNMIRVQLLRASIYGCSVMLQALKDNDIDQLKVEIDELKKQIGALKP